MFTIVCVYNDTNIFQDYLLNSLKSQNINYELIAINNSKNKYKSAAEALNAGGRKATGKYIMFVHQDVVFISKTSLKELETMLDSITKLGVAGVAGRKDGRGTISNITHGQPAIPAGKTKIMAPTKVQTIDECLVIIPRSIFNNLNFDEVACDHWHLYSVDFSLSVIQMGFNVYVLPISIYHRSTGNSMSREYFISLNKVIKKHGTSFPIIYTTMGDWRADIPIFLQRNLNSLQRNLNRVLKKM